MFNKIFFFILFASIVLKNNCMSFVNADHSQEEIEKYASTLSSLFRAAFDGNLEVLKKLVSEGANLNEKNENGATILICAIGQIGDSLFNYLLEQKVEINYYDKEGFMPIHMAIAIGEYEKFKKLFELQNTINIKTNWGADIVDLLQFAKSIYEEYKINYSKPDKNYILQELKKIILFIKSKKIKGLKKSLSEPDFFLQKNGV